MLRKLYDWVLNLAGGRHAGPALGVIAFAESSFFPVPPDIMLAPMVYAQPGRAWRYATICTVCSVLGGMLGYAIGVFLAPIGMAILSFFGHRGGLDEFRAWYANWGVWVILIKGLTPIPYKLVTIASGLAKFNFGMFIAASVVTRGARFFLVAFLVKKFGPAMQPIIERRLALFAALLVGVIVLGVLVVEFVL